jgi:AbrB family looped-hinge helix DNA binding protein
MSVPATTRMSAKGQVVIPEKIRRRLGLQAGSRFVIVGDRGTIILKSITAPSFEEFDDLVAAARKQARRAGLKRSDVTKAVRRVRGRK